MFVINTTIWVVLESNTTIFQTPQLLSQMWLKFWNLEALIWAESGVKSQTGRPDWSFVLLHLLRWKKTWSDPQVIMPPWGLWNCKFYVDDSKITQIKHYDKASWLKSGKLIKKVTWIRLIVPEPPITEARSGWSTAVFGRGIVIVVTNLEISIVLETAAVIMIFALVKIIELWTQ